MVYRKVPPFLQMNIDEVSNVKEFYESNYDEYIESKKKYNLCIL